MAIARDTLAGNTSLGLDNPTSGNAYTRAFDCGSGSLRRVWFAYFGTQNATDTVTGVTYAGVSMVFVGHAQQQVGSRWIGLYFLDAPATGSNNFVATVSPNDTMQAWASCYTGVKQTGAVDASGTNTANATSISKAITVVAANCWGIGFLREESGATATWSNAITNELSGTGGGHFADSNGTLGTGSQTATVTFGGAQNMALVWASFEPDTGGGGGGRGLFRTPSATGVGIGGSFFRDPLQAREQMVKRNHIYVPERYAA